MNESDLQDHQPLCARIGIALLAVAVLGLLFMVSTALAWGDVESSPLILIPVAWALVFDMKQLSPWVMLAAFAVLGGLVLALPVLVFPSTAGPSLLVMTMFLTAPVLLGFLIVSTFSKALIVRIVAFGAGIGMILLPLSLAYYPPGLWQAALGSHFWVTFFWGAFVVTGVGVCWWCFRVLMRRDLRSAVRNVHLWGWTGLGLGVVLAGIIVWGLTSQGARVGRAAIQEALGPDLNFQIQQLKLGIGPDAGRGSATVVVYEERECWTQEVSWPPPPLPGQVQTQDSRIAHTTITVTEFPSCRPREAHPEEEPPSSHTPSRREEPNSATTAATE